jgi:predicted 3-demethylubiquinone-9 3-methyltransferase (glyoxalase superfamily)
MTKITTQLWFDNDEAADAVELYTSMFSKNGESTVTSTARYGTKPAYSPG